MMVEPYADQLQQSGQVEVGVGKGGKGFTTLLVLA